jgi:hypothetical protein
VHGLCMPRAAAALQEGNTFISYQNMRLASTSLEWEW